MLNAAERQKLARILGMLGSDQVGERASAAQRAEELRKRHNLTWAELLAMKPAPAASSDYARGQADGHTAGYQEGVQEAEQREQERREQERREAEWQAKQPPPPAPHWMRQAISDLLLFRHAGFWPNFAPVAVMFLLCASIATANSYVHPAPQPAPPPPVQFANAGRQADCDFVESGGRNVMGDRMAYIAECHRFGY